MKIYQITEAPLRVEPKISLSGNPRADIAKIKGQKIDPKINVPKNLPTSVDIKRGILDQNGKQTFNVVDQDGKVLKRFGGPNAEADANTHRDKLKKDIKSAKKASNKQNTQTKKITGDPETDLDKDNPKAKKKLSIGQRVKAGFKAIDNMGRLKTTGSGIGLVVAIIFSYTDLKDAAKDYVEALAEHGEPDSTTHPTYKKKNEFYIRTASAITGLFTGMAGGAIGAAVASKFFLAVPGFGWVAALVAGASGMILAYVLNELADREEIINPLSDMVANYISTKTIKALGTDAVVYENDQLDEDAAKSEIKNAVKSAIMNDPKLMQAFKKAQQIKRAKSKAS